jgi:hypothetical protein
MIYSGSGTFCNILYLLEILVIELKDFISEAKISVLVVDIVCKTLLSKKISYILKR